MKKLKCGLLGRKLGHSYSPQIHALLGDYEYTLIEREPEQVEEFIRSGDFDAINVTIPYKTAVMPYLDEIDESARGIGSVNTVVRTSDGRLCGYNTDAYGMEYMLRRAGIDVKGKKVLVLGSGGSSLTARYVLGRLGAAEVVVISRSGEDNYANIHRHFDAEVILNTTPVGMYPNVACSPLSLEGFRDLKGVADIIYNPRRTDLLADAEDRCIPAAGGLSMLCAQAKAASELFTGRVLDDALTEKCIEAVGRECENIILIGMPGCGKSRVSAALGELLGRRVIDTDALVEQSRGTSIPEIFALEGEEAFRRYEHEAVELACAQSGAVIATGGGAPTRQNNHRPMRRNGRIVYLRRPVAELSRNGRPLSEGADMDAMFCARRPFYEGCADYTVDVREAPEITARAVIEAVYGGKR